MGVKFAFVEDLGGVGADSRMQLPAAVEKQSEYLGHQLCAIEDVGQDRAFGAGREGSLEWLVQLLRMAEQHEVPRAQGGDDCVRQGHLAWLVDEEDVAGVHHVLPGPEPGGAADHVDGAGTQGRSCGVVVPQVDGVADGGPFGRTLPYSNVDSPVCRCFSDLRQELSDPLVAVGGNPDPASLSDQVDDHLGTDGALAGTGGPCMAR